MGFIASDEQALSLEDPEALLKEIQRLQAEVQRLEQRVADLDRLAHRDPLVDLPNRRAFVASLENLILRVERYGDPAAMIFIDLDGLKRINDRFGHEAGDAALIQVAKQIVAVVRKSDHVGRIGGDEFGVLLERADELGAWQMGLRIVEQIVGSEFGVNGNRLPLSVAIGVGAIRNGDSPQSVMNRADKAMYRLKAGLSAV
jgi:diguanylate cyclase (GGDEF)-like protein